MRTNSNMAMTLEKNRMVPRIVKPVRTFLLMVLLDFLRFMA